ncbi:MAG TPA: hypothetical protein VGE18_02185 [Candidatus Paceibacterota bacterium]
MEKTDIVFILKVGDNIFSNESFLEWRPEPGKNFLAVGCAWVCKNNPEETEGINSNTPVYGEFLIPQSVSLEKTINTLENKKGWQKEGKDRAKSLISKYFTETVHENPSVKEKELAEAEV